jgi:hypothetical protein
MGRCGRKRGSGAASYYGTGREMRTRDGQEETRELTLAPGAEETVEFWFE